jgi:hypothetical protein
MGLAEAKAKKEDLMRSVSHFINGQSVTRADGVTRPVCACGDLNEYGEDGIRFFTRTKVVTQRWPHGGPAT